MLEPNPCAARRELFTAGEGRGGLLGFVAAEVALEAGFGVKPHSTASAGCLSRLLQAVWLAEVPGVIDLHQETRQGMRGSGRVQGIARETM